MENCSFLTLHPGFRKSLVSAFFALSVPTGFLNFVVIYTIFKTQSLHRPSTALVLNLALADFFIGTIACPLAALGNILLLKGMINTWCKVWLGLVQVLFSLSSIRLCFLMITSIDRFLAIKYKFSYKNIVTNKRVACVSRSAWVTVFIISTLLSAFILNMERLQLAKMLRVTWTTAILFLIAMLIMIIVFSSLSFYNLRKTTSQTININQQLPSGSSQFDVRKYRRTFNTMMIILVTILSFYVPVFFFAGLQSILKPKDSILRHLTRVGEWLVYANSAVNPLVYLWRIKELRQAVKAKFKRRTRILLPEPNQSN